jgi:excisionase family DNA binding protein
MERKEDMNTQKSLRVKRVAELVGVASVTVRRWCEAGKGPRGLRTPGGHWLFSEEDVQQWLKTLEKPVETRPDTA